MTRFYEKTEIIIIIYFLKTMPTTPFWAENTVVLCKKSAVFLTLKTANYG